MSTATIVRRNHHTDPRATAIGNLWGYQLGTGETAATTLVTESTPKRTNLVANPRAIGRSWVKAGSTGTEDRPLTDGPLGRGYQRYIPSTVTTSSPVSIAPSAGGTTAVPVVAGRTYTFSVYGRALGQVATMNIDLAVNWYDAAGANLSNDSTYRFNNTSEWKRYEKTLVAPDGAAFALTTLRFSVTASSFVAGGEFGADHFQVEEAPVAGPAFDGDTPDAAGVLYDWTGAANASTSTATFNDGPVLPDGSQIGTYARRTVTAAKTAGSSGPWCRTATGTFGLVAGDQVSPTMHVRFSVPVTITVQSTARNGSAGAGAVNVANVAVPANTWTRIGDVVTATGAADNTQVWAVLAAGTILPVGTTVDTTGGQSELGGITPYLDGTLAPTTLPDGSTLVRTWTGAANASSSIETRVPALLSAYVEPEQARVRLEVYGGDPGAALYLFRRDTAGVGIVRDTSEGTAGFPELAVEDRNDFPYPKPATVDGWATPNGATLAVVDSGSGVPALAVSRATVGDGSVWGPGAEPDLPVAPVVGTPLRIVAEWMPQHAASYALALVTVDAAGAVLETVATSTVVVAAGSTGTWRTVTLSGTPAVAGAVYARIRIVPTYTSPNRAPNPSFETDAADVQLAVPSSMVIERGAAGATDGANALRVSLVAPVSQYMYSGERVAAGAVGTWVGFSVDVSAQAGSAFLRPALVFRDASGTQVGSTVLGSFVTATATPQRVAITGQVPSGATQVDAVVYPHSSTASAAPAVGTVTTLDALMITTGAASSAAATTASATYRPPPVGELYRLRRILQGPGAAWFDGDSTTATPGYGYDWLGANDASPSVFGAYAAGQFHDYEARQGESTDYLLADGDGNLLAAVTVTIPLWGTWLKSPGRPSRNVRCFFGSEEEVRRRARREAYDVEGSAQVTITAGVRARPEGQLTLVTREAETARAMNLLLDDGATLMLDTPPSWGVSFRYLSVGDVAIVRPLTAADGFQGLTGEARLFQLADVVAEAVPAGVTAQDPGRTYATVASLFATYAAIAATVPTYDALATGEG